MSLATLHTGSRSPIMPAIRSSRACTAGAVHYLQQLGKAAESEVAKRLTDPDNKIRQVAWKAIAIVGSKANLATYQMMAMGETDGFAQIHARNALNAIAAQ